MPFLPIAGFQGSDLPARLGWKTVRDPYGGEELVAVPSVRPDWAVIHVPEADARGNARIHGTPFWDRLAARAARRVLITAERIVPSEVLAEQPELTAIPELFVSGVVLAPGGAWPGSCYPEYGVDYPAVEAYLACTRDPAGLRAHLEEARRLCPADRGQTPPPPPAPPRRGEGPGAGLAVMEARAWGPAELMAVAMARLLHDGEVVFHGVNSMLPMVAVALARRLHAPRLRAINIAGGIDPRPRFLPRSTTDPELARGSAAVLGNEDFYDLCMRGGVDTAFLGAAQVDAQGRTNVSAIGPPDRPVVRLPGGGGAAVIMPTAGRTIVWRAEHSRRSFVERLDFVTATGNVDRVVTELCVFRRLDGRLEVESVHPTATPEEVVARTGFDLSRQGDWPETPPPTDAELAALADVDPERVRRLEFR